MWRNATCVVGGLFVASAAAFLVPATGSIAQSSSFDSRWLAIDPAQKADRIEGPRRESGGQLYFFELPTVGTTVVVKDHRKPERKEQTDGVSARQNGSMNRPPVRPVPVDIKSKDKLPIGCESSFSPVTTPTMAHVSARCLS
jgi:hypothetical protein